MSNNPHSVPAAKSEFAGSKPGRVIAIAVNTMRFVGFVMLLYWSVRLIQHVQFWDMYQHEMVQDSNPLLGAYYRAFIDIAAIVAGILMFARSKWALLPLALHFVAYLCFISSITHGSVDLRMYPHSAVFTLIADAFLLALLLTLEARKALTVWPLRDMINTR